MPRAAYAEHAQGHMRRVRSFEIAFHSYDRERPEHPAYAARGLGFYAESASEVRLLLPGELAAACCSCMLLFLIQSRTHSICEKQLLQSRGIVPVAQLDSATPS